jgi:hypothetical protein
MLAVYLACLGLTLVIVVGISIWGVSHDLNQVRETLVAAEMQRLRSHGARTVRFIQDKLRENPDGGYAQIRDNERVRRHWKETVLREEAWLYAAVVDPSGKIVVHSDLAQEGKQVDAAWYDQVVPEGGDDVVLTQEPALTGGEKALDVRIPIYLDNQVVGVFHNGLSHAWLEEELARKRAALFRLWGWILFVIVVVLVAAGLALLQISRRLAVLRERSRLYHARRFAEVGQLMMGIAHEIRNPLNAMRLNLHVLGRHQARLQAGLVAARTGPRTSTPARSSRRPTRRSSASNS